MPLALFLAGVFLLIVTLPGLIRAVTTGVIVRKGHGAVRIERNTEPERFKALLNQRITGTAPGFLLMLAGLAWFFLNGVSSTG